MTLIAKMSMPDLQRYLWKLQGVSHHIRSFITLKYYVRIYYYLFIFLYRRYILELIQLDMGRSVCRIKFELVNRYAWFTFAHFLIRSHGENHRKKAVWVQKITVSRTFLIKLGFLDDLTIASFLIKILQLVPFSILTVSVIDEPAVPIVERLVKIQIYLDIYIDIYLYKIFFILKIWKKLRVLKFSKEL